MDRPDRPDPAADLDLCRNRSEYPSDMNQILRTPVHGPVEIHDMDQLGTAVAPTPGYGDGVFRVQRG